ncbi:hypothetical protein C8R43DRAFT_1141451 [Mycena crocata]|nr:hypothetical protein C8R43DRAFT_1141451 [Mycena crocata]
MAERRPTDLEFFPDSRNFDSQKEHDTSKRKMYFVVPHMGIFTLLNEALAWEENHSQDGVIPALTMKQALGILDAHSKPAKVKQEAKSEAKVKTEPKELKRGDDTPSPKRPLYTDDEDDEDVPALAPQPLATFDDCDHTAGRKHADTANAEDNAQRRPVTRGSRGKCARAGPGPSSPARLSTAPRNPTAAPVPDISPTVSSVSSLSMGSSISTSITSHPVHNLGESASTAHHGAPRRGGAHGSPPRIVPAAAHPSTSSSRTPRRGSAAPRGAASAGRAGRRDDPTVHLGSSAAAALRSLSSGEPMKYKPAALRDLVEGRASASTSSSAASESARLLWNNAQCTLYKDTQMAVQEMGTKETVQVVDLEDLVEYVSGRAPAVGSTSAAL